MELFSVRFFLPKKGSLIFEIQQNRLTRYHHLSQGLQKGKNIKNRFARSIRKGWCPGSILNCVLTCTYVYAIIIPDCSICISLEHRYFASVSFGRIRIVEREMDLDNELVNNKTIIVLSIIFLKKKVCVSGRIRSKIIRIHNTTARWYGVLK